MLREGHNKGDKIGAQYNNSPSQGLTVGQNTHETSRILTKASCISVDENFEEMPKVMELEGNKCRKNCRQTTAAA